jgi:hypothetical protein
MNKNFICAAIAVAFLAAPLAATAGEAELLARIEKMAAELEQLKAELKAVAKQSAAAPQASQQAAAPVAVPVVATASPAAPAAALPSASATTFSGYGEVNYNRPTKNASAAQADIRRAVIGIEHRFDERTKIVSEFEWEHAIASASDAGESAIEQLYVEREFKNGLRSKVGLFLIPSGLLNTNHEPNAYYGVERNFVETAIIPSTWREVGVSLSGSTTGGLTWDTGITTGFDLTKWDATSDEGRESPLGAIHQEGQLAKSRDLSVHAALNWRGVPGLLVGGSIFSGKAGHKTEGFAAQDARVTVYDLHTRYTPGHWDLSALYAYGKISNTDALNETLVGNATPVPRSFAGWYGQAAYQLLTWDDYVLSPFVRYEQFNTAKSYAALPPGLGVAPARDEKVSTVGLNLKVGEGIVLKADYQQFKEDKTRNRLNLGMGFMY